jgi:hypothetical protein
MVTVGSPETVEVVLAAEHLLWVLARADVENLSAPRRNLLQRLDELERRAADLNIPDLYRQVLLLCQQTSVN